MGKKFVDPKEIPARIITRFFREIEKADKKEFLDRASDPFGTEKLYYLMLVLEELDAEQKHWDRVADFVLKGASNKYHATFYTLTLLSLSPHVSITKREEIVKHLSRFGDFDNVLHLTNTQLYRMPNKEEVTAIAKYHREHHTSSDSEIWEKLLTLADDLSYRDEVATIIKMIAEIKEDEDNHSLDF